MPSLPIFAHDAYMFAAAYDASSFFFFFSAPVLIRKRHIAICHASVTRVYIAYQRAADLSFCRDADAAMHTCRIPPPDADVVFICRRLRIQNIMPRAFVEATTRLIFALRR